MTGNSAPPYGDINSATTILGLNDPFTYSVSSDNKRAISVIISVVDNKEDCKQRRKEIIGIIMSIAICLYHKLPSQTEGARVRSTPQMLIRHAEID